MNYLGYTPLSVPTSPALNYEFSDIRSVEYSLAAHDAIAQISISISGSEFIQYQESILEPYNERISYNPSQIEYTIGLTKLYLRERGGVQTYSKWSHF